MIFRNIAAYKLFNYILRSLAMFAVLALLVVGFTDLIKAWGWIILGGVVFITNYLTGGQPLTDKRIFISDSEMLLPFTELLNEMGYTRLEDNEIYFVKRSKYLRVYIVHMKQAEGRLLIEAPKKAAESLYQLARLNAGASEGVSRS